MNSAAPTRDAPERHVRVLLVDPSLFTAPYDAALTEGLLSAGVDPIWAAREARPGDRQELSPERVDLHFYKGVDRLSGMPQALRSAAKGLGHALGLVRLVARVARLKPDVVHFQWAVIPILDALAVFFVRRKCPVVLTVHDTEPCNGDRASLLQRLAFDLPVRLSDRVIVHTRAGKETLVKRGVSERKLTVIPHGPLRLGVESSGRDCRETNPRRTFVLFGEIKRYKGVDVLIEAVGTLPPAVRDAARFVVAGRPLMDLRPLRASIDERGLGGAIELLAWRQTEREMCDLFAMADCFLFPYRHVDASGVYFLVKSMGKWVIASRVGVFAEDIEDGVQGALVPPDDPVSLARAIQRVVERLPVPPLRSPGTEWADIGRATRDVYLQLRRVAASPSFPTLTRRDLVVGAPLVAACSPRAAFARTAPTAPAVRSQGGAYRLVKDWDFRTLIRDDAALRSEFHTRYAYSGGTLDHLGDEWSRYRDNHNHEFTESGLSLVARAVGAPRPGAIESGMLRSRWSGKYGIFEICMKVPRGTGLWPAFWLNPEDQKWPPEIDVVEIVDNGRDTTRESFHFLHGLGADGAKAALSKLDARHAFRPGVDYADAFHVFAIEWTADRVKHCVDGVPVVDREFRWRHDDGSDGGPAHVLVDLAVGGKWPGPPTAETPFPASLEVQYVRVWQS